MEEKTSVGAVGKGEISSKRYLVEPRYSRREQNAPKRFTISTLKIVIHKDEPMINEALAAHEAKQWESDIELMIKTLCGIDCWTAVDRALKEKVLNCNLFLRRKQHERVGIQKYKAQVVVCAND